MWLCEKLADCRGTKIQKLSVDTPTRGKAEAAYDAVLRLLKSCALLPGQHLRENELSSKLSIGRTPLREALIRLAAEGKILSLSKKGYFTLPLVEWALLDSYVVGRNALSLALSHASAEPVYRTVPCHELSAAELAIRTEAVFMEIGQRASNCEACLIIEKFCFCSHPLRMEMAASELSASFRTSLATLTDAMAMLGKETSLVKSALMNHLNLEQRAIPHAVQEISKKKLAGLSFIAGSL
ncbi:hypothetical protein ILFOPFJJ_01815 [Ensifer psoraleae]|uniref:GntR family transcriptional regulator n=1 Tax=Sinorhizobium psoraleae TaxID=520838 RepID=UPI0015691970|nr:GntR family transcriptional regulator [Sinorhizobium psoraleae]NRP70933.1 hypothetical protein [Sinorhizobium psoraleae]